MSLILNGTTLSPFLTGSANFTLSSNNKIIKDTAILVRPPIQSVSELIKNKSNCTLAITVTDGEQKNTLGEVYSNGVRLAYLDNLATLPISQQYNDNGGLVTSAYEGKAAVPF